MLNTTIDTQLRSTDASGGALSAPFRTQSARFQQGAGADTFTYRLQEPRQSPGRRRVIRFDQPKKDGPDYQRDDNDRQDPDSVSLRPCCDSCSNFGSATSVSRGLSCHPAPAT